MWKTLYRDRIDIMYSVEDPRQGKGCTSVLKGKDKTGQVLLFYNLGRTPDMEFVVFCVLVNTLGKILQESQLEKNS